MFRYRGSNSRLLSIVMVCQAIMLLLVPAYCSGQVERFELGKRLRRFEQAWEVASGERRAAAARIMQEAVQRFFSLNLAGAAGKLDEAWLMTDPSSVEKSLRGAIPFFVNVPLRAFGENEKSLVCELERLYTARSQAPSGCQVDWTVSDRQGKVLLVTTTRWEAAEENPRSSLSLEKLPVGDYHLTVKVSRGDESYQLPSLMFSRVSNLQERRDRLERIARDSESPLDDSVRATLREHLRLIEDLVEGRPVETDYPLNEILSLDERLVGEAADVRSVWSSAASGQSVWMVLAKGRRRVPVRIRSPNPRPVEQDADGKMPVMFLFHGAGGSENMFFETYGAGRAVKCGLERGWLVVATRQSLGGLALDCRELLDELEKYFPVDRKRVFLVGHSMGAAQVIRQTGLNPDVACGAAVIGGGSAAANAAGRRGIGWYVAAGELDFGRRGAEAFYKSMQSAGAKRLKYQEFPDVEHMVIVQASLDSMFEFFDQLGK